MLKQPESVTLKRAGFVQKQLYLIFIYSRIQAQGEICLVEKGYCVCVCFLHSADLVSALD